MTNNSLKIMPNFALNGTLFAQNFRLGFTQTLRNLKFTHGLKK